MGAMSEGQDGIGSMWQGMVDAQRQMWSQWADLAAAGAQTAGAAPTGAASTGAAWPGAAQWPGVSPWSGATDAWLASWRQLAHQTTTAWTAGADPVARDAAQGMAATQETMLRYGALMQQAWSMLSAPATSPEETTAKLDAFGRLMQQSIAVPWSSLGTPPGDVNSLWAGYLAALERLPGPWANLIKEVPMSASRAFGGDSSELLGQTRLLWDAWERSAGRLLETPSMGYSRETTEMLQRGFEAWVDYRRAVFEFSVVLNEAWAASGQAGVDMLRRRAEANTPITSLREFVNVWSEATDGSLEDAFRAPRYAEAQAAMLAAAMRYRLRERDIVETALKMTDIPSRSELDETNRRLHALKREVRELRRAMAAAQPTTRTAGRASTGKATGKATDKEVSR